MQWVPRLNLDRLDRAAETINPLLIMVAIVLAIFEVSCYSAIEIGRLLPPPPGWSRPDDPVSALGSAAVSRLPPD